MGTNYYLIEKPPCTCCGRGFESKHIGKSSAGWMFMLRVYPTQGIDSLEDWMKLFDKPGIRIEDEYGEPVKLTTLLDRIQNRDTDCRRQPITEYGSCIGHGPGTWDCLVGEFS